ncbi:MAG TPA: NCS2 family permease [Candidatus Binatia bacterium]|nr:NCS2 family permease [Candidatus Binatia bacterium]
MLESFFRLRETGTSVGTEIRAGATTFMTMSYIISVQPTVLASAGMDFGAVMMATCLSSALATFLMGLLANYPIALAPAMGHNFFFAFTVCLAMQIPWQAALGAVFISGTLFLFLSFFGLRESIINALPATLKSAIAAGIGLLIGLVGFEWAGIVVDAPGTLVGLGDLRSPPTVMALFGTILIAVLMVLKVRGAILLGIMATALIGIPLGLVKYQGIIGAPPSISPTLLQLDIGAALKLGLLNVIFIFFFLDLFDTVGTLVGVSQQGGFMKDGKLPRARPALLSDSFGTVSGALLGTSTVTSYIESSAGIAEGGRSGLANMVTGILFLASILFFPIAEMLGGGYAVSKDLVLYPVIAPALIIVGSMMLKTVRDIPWDDPTEAIPAFLTLMVMPMTFSITEGIAFGFISFALLKLVRGQGREVHWLLYLFAGLFVIRYLFMT